MKTFPQLGKKWIMKNHTKSFRLILLLLGDINVNPGPTQILETGQFSKNEGFTLFF